MSEHGAVVVGAGIFGSLIARALRKAGCRTLVVDAKRKDSGSAPAACLMRPSWFSSLGKSIYEPALRKLDELVGVQDIQFRAGPLGSKIAVHWCDPKQVLLDQNEVRTGEVVGITRKGNAWEVKIAGHSMMWSVRVPLVIVATGVWTKLLLPEVDVVAQAGVAWLWPKADIDDPFIKVWAPYKQIVAFNRGDGLWIGDGSTARSWTVANREASLLRCTLASRDRRVGGVVFEPTELFGYRPYVKDAKPCLFKELRKGLWVATGGAKNGTLAAGWCADQIVRAI